VPNLGEVGPGSAPAVKCAAEIIEAEAVAPQKIDALRYLGRVGCTKCYPCVEEGLIAALDDCTEEVRFEAAKAIRATASEECGCCKYTSCCTQKVYDKLYKVAYETRGDGCPVEPSPRVRRVARQALQMCGGPTVMDEDELEPTPTEGPSGAVPSEEPPSIPPPVATGSPAADKPADSPAPSASPAPQTSVPERKDVDAAATVAPIEPVSQREELKAAILTVGIVEKNHAMLPDSNDAAPRLPSLRQNGTDAHALNTSADNCSACRAKDAVAPQPLNPFAGSSWRSVEKRQPR
jgi:hypothetical protein